MNDAVWAVPGRDEVWQETCGQYVLLQAEGYCELRDELPADAVRLWPVEDVLRFGLFVANGAMTRADVERAYTRWMDWEESKSG